MMTDKKKSPIKKVYIFYGVIIAICILLMFVFHLNLYAKAVLGTLVFLCFCIIRSIINAPLPPPDIDPYTMQKVEPFTKSGSAIDMADADIEEAEYVDAETVEESTEEPSTISKGGAIDIYLSLLIETDEELSNDPSVDKSSPSYNNLLNDRIAKKLNAMSQGNNPTNKD